MSTNDSKAAAPVPTLIAARAPGSDSNNSRSAANLRFHLFRLTLLPLLPDEHRREIPPPIVIGAHGGSGSRALAQSMRVAGVWMGRWRSPQTEDALAPRFFLQRHFEEAMTLAMTPDQRHRLERCFRRMIRAHRFGLADACSPWGWKNPRFMWLIPFLASLYPRMTFVHLVRDGRDLALSKNRNLLRKHGQVLLRDQASLQNPLTAQLRLWALGNQKAAAEGGAWLGKRYLHLKYEQLCAAPYDTLAQLYARLGQPVSDELIERGAQLISPPQSIGAWRQTTHPALHQPEPEIAAALAQFGYL